MAPIASFLVVGLLQQASAQDDVRKQLEEIRASLQRVKSGLNQMGTPAPAPALRPTNPPVAPTATPVVPIPPKPAITKVEIVQVPSGSDANVSNAAEVLATVSLPPSLPRNYFIPFAALSLPVDGEWISPILAGTFEVDEGSGFSAGLRLGREFSWGLLEFELKGFRNSYRRTDIHLLLPPVQGSASGASMLGNVGGRLALTERSSLFAGLGLGLAYVDSHLDFVGYPGSFGDSGVTFAYQVFLGFEHAFSQSMEVFLRYKFFGTTDLDHFSGRRLHELEAGLGFLF